MNQFQLIAMIAVIVALFSCAAKTVMAADTPFISEIYPAPNLDENEWIELTNPLDQIATISGWLIYDQVSSPSLLLTITTVELAPHEVIAFDLPTAKLNNSGDSVVLLNHTGFEIDRFSYDTSEVGKSWQKYTQLTDHFLATPTKSAPSVPPSPTLAPSPTLSPTVTIHPSPTVVVLAEQDFNAIEITEVVACPNTNEREWIELYNTGETTVSLQNWYISDAQGNHELLHGAILSKSFFIIDWDRAILNNQGDSISLFTNTDQLLLTLQIPPCTLGTSFFPSQESSNPASSIHAVTFTPTQLPALVTFSTSPEPPNSLVATRNSLGSDSYLPATPSIFIETPLFGSSKTSVPMQIHTTFKIGLLPLIGAIISLSSLLLAYYFFDVVHKASNSTVSSLDSTIRLCG